jgi:hypothetical protein
MTTGGFQALDFTQFVAQAPRLEDFALYLPMMHLAFVFRQS